MSKILVIEDETPVRENLIELLIAEGYQAIGARDGEEGVRRTWEELPDLIICDIMMPKLDGYGVLARIRRDTRLNGIPFLFLTARVAREDLRKGMEMGADDFITKPFKRIEVLQAINARLERMRRLEIQTEKKLTDVRDRITMDLPHELMTPLSVTIGFSELLAEQVDQMERDEIRKLARDIHHSARHLLRLVENSLMLAELWTLNREPDGTARKAFEPVPVPLLELVENKAQLANRAGDLMVQIAPARFIISEQYLGKIMDEVLDNAFKFSATGSQVSVVGAMVGITGMYRLKIGDRGRGMTPEQIRRVNGWTPFDRHLYEQQGAGLGMALVQQICQLVHGSVSIQSVPGEGTMVEVLLPAKV